MTGGRLGTSLVISPDGTRAAAGRPDDGSGGLGRGAVVTYTYDLTTAGWIEGFAAVEDQSPADFDFFGRSVAIDGEYMAVGSPGRDSGLISQTGSVSIFEWNGATSTWNFVTRITRPGGPQIDAQFGQSVDLQVEPGGVWTLVVGAPGSLSSPGIPVIGETFIFESTDPSVPTGWTNVAALNIVDPDGAFGTSVAISGPSLVVGDPVINSFDGSAYVFERSGGVWGTTPVAEVVGSLGSRTGFAVDIDGDTAVIGAPDAVDCSFDEPPGCPSTGALRGSAVVLDRVGGAWLSSGLRSLDDGTGIRFGFSVSVSDDRIAVGAVEGGTVALYGRTAAGDWFPAALTRATDPPVSGHGSSVALAPGERGLLTGWASDDVPAAVDGGSILRWDPAADCNDNSLPDECEAQFNMPALDCDANGLIDACEIDLDPALDCNANGVLDTCEIAEAGSLVDINDNGILDECEGPDCNGNLIADAIELRSVEIVWLIDTSGSQTTKFNDVCDIITALETDLRSASDPANAVFPRSRYVTLGSVVPGALPCGDVIPFEEFEDIFDDDLTGLGFPAAAPPTGNESWSAAAAIAARDNDWRTNHRIVIPISDECGWNDPSACDANDVAAILAARDFLRCVDVMAFPIQFEEESGWLGDVLAQMQILAGTFRDLPPPATPIVGTGGQAFTLQGSTPALVAADLAAAIRDSLPIHDNDANGILDQCELDPDESDDLTDCNLNLIDDAFEVRLDIGMEEAAPSNPDLPLECFELCAPDVNGDTTVDFTDILEVLSAWGPCPPLPAPCSADVNLSGAVDFLDLLEVLAAFGPCRTPPPCQTTVAARPPAPQSIIDCIQKYGNDAQKLQKCIEAMILADTP